jgi:hypothetical protein
MIKIKRHSVWRGSKQQTKGIIMESTATDVNMAAAGGIGMVGMIIYLALILFMLVAYWKIFTKAGQPGWGTLVPIYNAYLMLKIAGKPGWWLLLMFIPVVNFVVFILMIVSFAENFGKSVGFAIGMIFLPFIFFPILAFGDATYAQTA